MFPHSHEAMTWRHACASKPFPSTQPSPRSSTVVLFNADNLKLSALTVMSQNRSTNASSSKFQFIINDALKVYSKRTKNDLLLHPLAIELQNCESSTDILTILQQQVQGLDQSPSDDDRWTKWLDPTISVLLTFSQTAGTVGLVCPTIFAYPRSAHSYLFGRHSHPRR